MQIGGGFFITIKIYLFITINNKGKGKAHAVYNRRSKKEVRP